MTYAILSQSNRAGSVIYIAIICHLGINLCAKSQSQLLFIYVNILSLTYVPSHIF